MCWLNNMATPIVLKKPLKVYKVGTPVNLRKPRVHRFISLYQDFIYCKCKTMPTIEINLEFTRYASDVGYLGALWEYDRFYIHEGYHSYLTEETAKYARTTYSPHVGIGVFEIPIGATIYVNYKLREVVSTDIKYLGALKL